MKRKHLFGRFALGASLGVALTIAATQAWNVSAAPGDSDSTFVPVAPCRLFDTRPGEPPLSGTKSPIGAGAANARIQQVTGNIGNCVGIPSDAVAVAMNVTIANPTAASYLNLVPANEPVLTVANLNWVAGQGPTPNLVTVKLSPDGKVKLYNHAGTVNVIADVAGYYTRTSLTEINQRLAALEAGGGGGAMPVVAYASALDEVQLPVVAPDGDGLLAANELLTLTLTAPSAGKVTVIANATAKSGTGNFPRLVCQITDNAASTTVNAHEILGIASPAAGGNQPSLGTNRVFDVAAGTRTFDLMCTATGDPGASNKIHYRSMSAMFTPTP